MSFPCETDRAQIAASAYDWSGWFEDAYHQFGLAFLRLDALEFFGVYLEHRGAGRAPPVTR